MSPATHTAVRVPILRALPSHRKSLKTRRAWVAPASRQSSRRRFIMRRLIALVLLWAAPLLAQSQHQVFKIQFQSRLPATILLSQSMLTENRSYTDEELQLAMA